MAIFVLFALIEPVLAAGSGAFRIETHDAEAMGKGSAFVGEADNPSAVYYNPAGMTQLEGTQFSGGFASIMPTVEYHNGSGTNAQMTRQIFHVPHLYLTSDLGTDKFAIGIGQTSYFGLGTAWTDDSFARYNATKSDLVNIDGMITFAYELNDKWSFGIAADHDYGTVNKTKKILQSGANDDADLQLKGKSADWGYRLSALFQLNERHQFGLQYRSAIQKDYKGKITLNNLNDAGATPYNTIFGGSSFEADLHSELELPQSIVFGYSFTPNEKWRFNFDVEWMDWSSVEDEYLRYDTPLTGLQSAVLNNGNPASKDWDSVYSASLGAEYQLNEKMSLRGGV
jgi:long-chain fatty acid transport protein